MAVSGLVNVNVDGACVAQRARTRARVRMQYRTARTFLLHFHHGMLSFHGPGI